MTQRDVIKPIQEPSLEGIVDDAQSSTSGARAGNQAAEHTKPDSKRPTTKKLVMRKLMARKSGATMQALTNATGWQPHSVRAALSGMRHSDLHIERGKNRKGETVYAIKTPKGG